MKVRHLLAQWKSRLSGRPETYSRWYDRIFWSLREGDIAVDCGANVGHYTAIMARSGATVHAFEPHPHAFDVLEARFRDADNVHCYKQAVFNENSMLPLYLHKHAAADPLYWSTGSSLLNTKPNVDVAQSIEVPAIDFATFIESLRHSVALVKMDIEGAEAKVLTHLIETGTVRKIRHLLVEAHDRRLPEIAAEMERVRLLIRERKLFQIDLEWT